MNDYKNSYKYYDQIYKTSVINNDIKFYLHFAKNKMKILDVGCGTGRIGINLAIRKKGCIIDAIDISDEMLGIFKEKLEKNKRNIRSIINVHLMDMNDIILKDKYDLIVFPFQSFQVVTGRNNQLSLLKIIRSLLAKNGRLIISLFDITSVMNTDFNKKTTFISNFVYSYENKHKFMQITKDAIINYENKIYSYKNDIMIFDEKNILIDEVSDDFIISHYDFESAVSLFKDSGFLIEKIYKNYEFYQLIYGKNSSDMIFILK